MKLLEMKNRLALETAKLIFQNKIDVVFIGGTALNTFYIDYRYSEDLDLGYAKKNTKSDIEDLLKGYGYAIDRTDFDFRDILSLEGVSIKMDVIEYKQKYNGIEEKEIGETKIKTLKLEEFAVEKIISFFTREDLAGMARDAYDIFSMDKKYKLIPSLLSKTKGIIRKETVTLDHNVNLFENNMDKMESAVAPYLRKPIEAQEVLKFLKTLKGVLSG